MRTRKKCSLQKKLVILEYELFIVKLSVYYVLSTNIFTS